MATTHSTTSVARLPLMLRPLLDLAAEARRRWEIRRSYGVMSVARLRDIGLTPHDVVLALALPLEQDAGEALARAAASEAARW